MKVELQGTRYRVRSIITFGIEEGILRGGKKNKGILRYILR